MRKIGSHLRLLIATILLASTSALAASAVEFSQTVDRTEVGDEDTFNLTVSSSAGSVEDIQTPQTDDFEVLSRSASTQMSFSMGTGAPGMRRTVRVTLVMRANKTGKVTIPPSQLQIDGKAYKTDSIVMDVKKGRQGGGTAQRGSGVRQRFPSGFPNFPGFPGFPGEDEDDSDSFPDMEIPRSDSDLFLQAAVDKNEGYVGEQITYSIYLMSRVDVSSVDQLTLPKLDGFWTEEIDSPQQLSGEQRIVNGVPYRAYLLKRRALFPMKPGKMEIAPVEATVTTGFMFAGHRIQRKSKAVVLDVKPLPSGAPPGFAENNVGKWHISVQAPDVKVPAGQPATVRVVLEGVGNIRNASLPKLVVPPSMKVYDPTPSDQVTTQRGRVEGRRTNEYLVLPQQSGTFTLPELSFPYFDPKSGQYDVAKSEPLAITVEPGSQVVASGTPSDGKNVLTGGALRPLRYQARFETASRGIWRSPGFIALVVAPFALWLGFALFGLWRRSIGQETAQDVQRKRTKAARARLASAEKLKAQGTSPAFFGEVEKGLLGFFEAKTGDPLGGLRREALMDKLSAAGFSEPVRKRVSSVLDACDLGRFAPGSTLNREQVMRDAASVMEDAR